MIKKTITLKQLPIELFSEYSKHGTIEFKTHSSRIIITAMRTKSNVADINGSLYFFGNTYNQINPYKTVKNYNDLVYFCNQLAHSMDELIKGHLTDVTYLSVSDIMNDGKTAEKLLTVKDTVYPDYTVELLDKDQFEIMIDEDRGIVSTDENLVIEKVGSFDLHKLFRAEYLNSLYIVKMA